MSVANSRKTKDPHSDQKSLKKLKALQNNEGTGSYLVRAMESQKISKITWESLFNMK